MFPISSPFTDAAKTQFENQLSLLGTLAGKAFDSAEKIAALNLSASKAALAQGSVAAKQVLDTTDPRELLSFSTSQAQPAIESIIAYSRQLFGIASSSQAELIATAKARLDTGADTDTAAVAAQPAAPTPVAPVPPVAPTAPVAAAPFKAAEPEVIVEIETPAPAPAAVVAAPTVAPSAAPLPKAVVKAEKKIDAKEQAKPETKPVAAAVKAAVAPLKSVPKAAPIAAPVAAAKPIVPQLKPVSAITKPAAVKSAPAASRAAPANLKKSGSVRPAPKK